MRRYSKLRDTHRASHLTLPPGDYPYKAADGKCQADPKKPVCGTCSGHTDVAATETALQTAASGRVISIAIAAEQDFMFYSKGIYDSTTCPTDADHLNHGQRHRMPASACLESNARLQALLS